MTAHATLSSRSTSTGGPRRTAAKAAVALLVVAVLLVGCLVLRSVGAHQQDPTATVAELDTALGITATGSHQLDRVPSSVLRRALDRASDDAGTLRATGAPAGSVERLGVTFETADRAAAERLAALLTASTRFTVAVTAPHRGTPHWAVGGITRRTAVTVPVLHQLTLRMTEAAWRSGDATYTGWRIVTR